MTALPAAPALLTLQGAALAYRETQQGLRLLQENYQAAFDRRYNTKGIVIGDRADYEAYLEAKDALELGKDACAQARARLHTAAMRDDSVSSLQQIVNGTDTRHVVLTWKNGAWQCDLPGEDCTDEGQADLPEHALVEALVERQLGEHYGGLPLGGPRLSQETMTRWLHGAYRHHLGLTPDHEYRGGFEAGTEE